MYIYIYFLLSLSLAFQSPVSLSLFLYRFLCMIPLYLFLSRPSIPAVFSNVSLPFKREGKDGEGGGSLSEFLVRVAVTLSQIHFAVGEFPLVHVPGIGTRAAFQSREFPRRFLPLLPRVFFFPALRCRLPLPPPFPAPLPPQSSTDRLENGATEKICETLLNGLYLICARGSSEGIRRDYSHGEWKQH